MPPQPAFYAEEGGVPVFTPTYEEFRDFATFVQAIEAFGNTAGLVKVIPPQEWHELNPTSVDRVQKLQIRNAISQSFSCGGYPAGIQQVMNIETKKQYSGILFHSVQEWYELSQTEAHRAPTMTMDGKMNLPLIKRRKYMHPAPGAKENQSNSNLHSSIAGKKKRSKKTLPEFMKTPTYFTPEYLSQLERFYWRNVSFESPLYGADMAGSVFGTNPNNKWNVARLESLLNKYPFPVPGVNLPYLYFGMYKATFAWHVEDMDLCSINYIHFGAPKQWYVVAPEHRLKFERFATGVFHEDYKVCKEFLRHKTCIISPSLLQQLSIPVHKVVQRAGEYMLTFPGAYHLGYNCGFNCAESVNFAFDSWIKIGKKSKACLCIGDTVRLDIPTLLDPSSCLTEAMKREYIASDQRSRRGLSKPDAAPLPTLPDPKCALCPKGHSDRFPLIETDVEHVMAHKICAMHILEPLVETALDKRDRVVGIKKIPGARWSLKCSVCRLPAKIGKHKVGACIQCITGKCVRAYHVTCALLEGIPVEMADGLLVTYCSAHDPLKRQERDAKKFDSIQDRISKGSEVVARCGSFFYFGIVSSVTPGSGGCMVVFEEGEDAILVLWNDLKLRPATQERQPQTHRIPIADPQKSRLELLKESNLN